MVVCSSNDLVISKYVRTLNIKIIWLLQLVIINLYVHIIFWFLIRTYSKCHSHWTYVLEERKNQYNFRACETWAYIVVVFLWPKYLCKSVVCVFLQHHISSFWSFLSEARSFYNNITIHNTTTTRKYMNFNIQHSFVVFCTDDGNIVFQNNSFPYHIPYIHNILHTRSHFWYSRIVLSLLRDGNGYDVILTKAIVLVHLKQSEQ